MNHGGHSPLEQTGHASCSLLVAQLPVSEASHWKERRVPRTPTVLGGGREISGWFLWCLQQWVIVYFT